MPDSRPAGEARPSWEDCWRLAFGTLTALPVGHPARVERATFGVAMVLAPVTTVPAVGSWIILGLLVRQGLLPVWVAGVLAIGVSALLSRALHLDGLADLADGLTAGHDPARSLEVMRRGDTGPAGTGALVIVLLLDAACLATLLTGTRGLVLATVALVASRLAPPLCARDGIPAARAEGLGMSVAGTVSRGAAWALVLGVGAAAAVVCWIVVPAASDPDARWRAATGGVLVVLGAAAGALAVRRRAVRRLGGVTGDVIGAAIEVALATALTVAVVLESIR